MSFTEQVQKISRVDDPAAVSAVVQTEVFRAVDDAFERYSKDCKIGEFAVAGALGEGEHLNLFGPDFEGLSLTRHTHPIYSTARDLIVITPDKTVRNYSLIDSGDSSMVAEPPKKEVPAELPGVAAARELFIAKGFFDASGEPATDNIENIMLQLAEVRSGKSEVTMADFMLLQEHFRIQLEWEKAEMRRLAAIEASIGPIPTVRHARALGTLISQALPKAEFLHAREPHNDNTIT